MLPYAKYFETSIVIRYVYARAYGCLTQRSEYLDEAPARIAYEFRGFACKNQLNALTQVWLHPCSNQCYCVCVCVQACEGVCARARACGRAWHAGVRA